MIPNVDNRITKSCWIVRKRRYERAGKESRGERSFHTCRKHSAFVLHMKIYRRKWPQAVRKNEAMNKRQWRTENNRRDIQLRQALRCMVWSGVDMAKPGSDRTAKFVVTWDSILEYTNS